MRFNLKKWQPYLEQLRALIAEAKGAAVNVSQAPAPPDSLGVQLKELADLHQSGVLDDVAFAQAKARILAGE